MFHEEGPPPGYLPYEGVLEPSITVAGYAARHQRVHGKCGAEGCNRRVVLDPHKLLKLGYGRLVMAQVQRTFCCNRLAGCTLTFHAEEPAMKVRLQHLTGRTHVRIRLRCSAGSCKFYRVWVVEKMVAALQKAGKGGPQTAVDDLGPLMTGPCPACSKVNWRADVLWADTKTMGWKQRGERMYADMVVGDDI